MARLLDETIRHSTMPDNELLQMFELCRKATPGPWVSGVNKRKDPSSLGLNFVPIALTAPGQGVYRDISDPDVSGGSYPSNDQDFIVAAREHMAGLIREVLRLRSVLKTKS